MRFPISSQSPSFCLTSFSIAALLLVGCSTTGIAPQRPAASQGSVFLSTSPDGRDAYTCHHMQKELSGCFTHWCRASTKEASDRLAGVSFFDGKESRRTVGAWTPCYLRKDKDSFAMHVSGGGVPWWGWSGRLGQPTLADFWDRDYRMNDDEPVTSYGRAVLDHSGPAAKTSDQICYRTEWQGKEWGYYCLSPMQKM